MVGFQVYHSKLVEKWFYLLCILCCPIYCSIYHSRWKKGSSMRISAPAVICRFVSVCDWSMRYWGALLFTMSWKRVSLWLVFPLMRTKPCDRCSTTSFDLVPKPGGIYTYTCIYNYIHFVDCKSVIQVNKHRHLTMACYVKDISAKYWHQWVTQPHHKWVCATWLSMCYLAE